MTTRENDFQLESRIRQLLRDDVSISNRELGRRVRAEGLRVANTRLRVLANLERRLLSVGDSPSSRRTELVRVVSRFTAKDIGQTFQRIVGDLQQQASVAVIDATIRAQVRVTFYGAIVFDGIWEQAAGKFILPNRPQTNFEALIEGGALSRIEGEIVRQFAQGTDSYVEGLDIEIRDISVNINDIDFR